MVGSLFVLLIVAFFVFRITKGRGRSFTKQLGALLSEAEKRQIIVPEQTTRLLSLAENLRPDVKLSATTWLAILAGLSIIAGIGLLISHNWENIGSLARVVCFLLLFGFFGEMANRTKDRTRAIHLPFEFGWFFMPILGIGLYGQTFQLSGDPIRPFLVWLLLTLPMVWISRYSYIGVTHFLVLISTLLYGNFTSGMLYLGSSKAGSWSGVSPLAWIITGLAWVILHAENRKLLPQGHRSHALGLVAAWMFGLFLLKSPFQMLHGAWLFMAAITLTVLWICLPLTLRRKEYGSTSGLVPWLGILYGFTFLWHQTGSFNGEISTYGMVLTLFLLFGAGIAIVVMPLDRMANEPAWRSTIRAVLLISLALPIFLLINKSEVVFFISLFSNLFFAAIGVLLMWHGGKFGSVWHVNVGVSIISLLLITRFIDVFGNMFRSGIGMIVAGVLLAVVAYGLDRGRKKLLSSARGNTP